MLEREAGYERQRKLGKEYYIIEDYYIELTVEKKEIIKKSLFIDPTPIAPVLEEEKEEPETEPAKTPELNESVEDENYIAVNIYEQADRESRKSLSGGSVHDHMISRRISQTKFESDHPNKDG